MNFFILLLSDFLIDRFQDISFNDCFIIQINIKLHESDMISRKMMFFLRKITKKKQ